MLLVDAVGGKISLWDQAGIKLTIFLPQPSQIIGMHPMCGCYFVLFVFDAGSLELRLSANSFYRQR